MRCIALVAFAASLATCNSPTGPGPCVNGVDGLGRGPVYSYNLSCAYVGSDTIQRTNGLREGGYSAVSGLRDVTAIVISPGVLKVIGGGVAQVMGRVGIQAADRPHVYAVAPGTTPERLIAFCHRLAEGYRPVLERGVYCGHRRPDLQTGSSERRDPWTQNDLRDGTS